MTKTYYIFLGISCLVCLGLGFFLTSTFYCACESKESFSLKDLEGKEIEKKEKSKKEDCDIVVDVSGAVMKPSVVCLQEGSVVNDAIVLADGFNPTAYAFKYVAQRINLARVLENEEKIYIPFRDDVVCRFVEQEQVKYIDRVMNEILGEQKGAVVEGETQKVEHKVDSKEEKKEVKEDDCISINHADKEKLMQLTGIGEARAKDIIEGRPYSKLEDLKEVKGIGDATFEKLKAFICL